MATTAKLYLIDRPREISTTAEAEGRNLTDGEKSEIGNLLAQVESISDEEAYRDVLDGKAMTAGAKRAMARHAAEQAETAKATAAYEKATGPLFGQLGLAGALQGARFDVKTNPSVVVGLGTALGFKDSTYPDGDLWNISAPRSSGSGRTAGSSRTRS